MLCDSGDGKGRRMKAAGWASLRGAFPSSPGAGKRLKSVQVFGNVSLIVPLLALCWLLASCPPQQVTEGGASSSYVSPGLDICLIALLAYSSIAGREKDETFVKAGSPPGVNRYFIPPGIQSFGATWEGRLRQPHPLLSWRVCFIKKETESKQVSGCGWKSS